MAFAGLTIAEAGGYALATVAVLDEGDAPAGAVADLAIDTSVSEAIVPRAGRVQVVGLRIRVGGVLVPPRHLIPPISVTQRCPGEAEASFALPVRGDHLRTAFTWPIGSPWNTGGPVPGLRAIDIEGFYVTETGIHVYPIITNGIGAGNGIRVGPAGAVLSLRVLGPGARYDGRRVSLVLDPGHRLGRRTVAARLARKAGVSSVSLSGGRPMTSGVEVVDADWRPTAEQLLELEGEYLTWSEDGRLTTAPRLPVDTESVVLTLTAHDLAVDAGDIVTWPADVVTDLTLTATRQVAADECGIRTTEQVVEIFEQHLPVRAAFRQGAAGALSAVSVPAGEEPILTLVRRIITTLTYYCDTVILQRVRTYALRNKSVWRYRIDDTGAIVEYHITPEVYILDQDAVTDDQALAYGWPVERFILESDEYTRNVYDEENYLTDVITERKAWRQRRAHLKERSLTFTGWDDEPFNLGANRIYVLGNGECVSDRDEDFSNYNTPDDDNNWTYRQTEHFEREGAYLKSKSITRRENYLPPGGNYLYLGGVESGEPEEVFGDVEKEIEAYVEVDETRAKRIASRIDYREVPTGRVLSAVVEDLDSYLPEAPRLLDGTPDPSEFETEEEAAAAVEASRLESEELRHACRSELLRSAYRQRDETQSVAYAEDEADLESLCVQRLREGAALDVSTTLPALFPPLKGKQVRVRVPNIDLDALVRVRTVAHADPGPGGAITTRVDGIAVPF